MNPKRWSWLVIGIGAIAAAAMWNFLEWGPSPHQAMAQDPVDSNVRPSIDVKSDSSSDAFVPNPGNPNPPKAKARGPRGVGLGGPIGGAPAKGYRPSTRTVARQVTENGQTRIVYETVTVMVPDTNAGKKDELNAAVRTAILNYQTAEGAESRAEIEARLTQSLTELFDLQQAEREEQLKPMEERVKKLRETLNKRAALRDDLIQLRLKVLLQDAEGLGWGMDDEFLPRTMTYDGGGDEVLPLTPSTPYAPKPVDEDEMPVFRTPPKRSGSTWKAPPKANNSVETSGATVPSP